jgi:hypothetical protein
MAVNGDHSIFRMTTAGDNTETLILTDKIEFDGDHVVPDARSHITSIKPRMGAINTDNPNPGSQDSPNSQDTGNAPTLIQIDGYFYEDSGTAQGIAKFRDWMRNVKVVKTDYPKGRFGFRSDSRPEFNVTPTSTSGYQLMSFEIDDIVEWNKQFFTVVLKHVGDASALGV